MSSSEQTKSNKRDNEVDASKDNTAQSQLAAKSERFIYNDDDELDKVFNWKQLYRLVHYIAPYRTKVIPAILIMMFVGGFSKLLIPLIISYSIDHAIADKNVQLLLTLSISMLVLYLIQMFAQSYRIRKMNSIGQQVIYDLRDHLFKHVQKLSLGFFDKRPAGSILVKITNYVNGLQDLITNGAVNLIIDIVQLFGIVIILLLFNFKLGIAVILTVPMMFFISTNLRLRIRKAWQEVTTRQSRLNAHLNESIQGIRVTEAYTQEKINFEYFKVMNEKNKQSWNFASGLNQAFGPMVEITGALGYCVLFWYGAHLIQQEEISLGLLVAFATYISYFWDPINRIGALYSQVLVAMASAERIFEYLDEVPQVPDRPDAKPLSAIVGNVKFDHLVFAYEAGRLALRGIDLDVRAGESIALVGHTGSGKSTIMNLLCRFYDPTEGRVLIDDTDIREVTLSSLRSQIGVVLQDTFIFSGTIMDNIRFGRLNATDEEVIAAARAVDADGFIQNMPDGYQTQVQERGNVLSMGQRQLISFARALLADPRILILDEATASIDTETEMKIQEALKVLLKDRTSFIVAHRLSTIRNADRIVVLDHGVMLESGSHGQLMKQQGTYYGLIEAQFRFLEDSAQ
jgi:ATP-binding cassette subfamily B multidrug efflux pump